MDFKVLCELKVEVCKLTIWNDETLLFTEAFDENFLPGSIERQLLFNNLIRTLAEDMPYFLMVI